MPDKYEMTDRIALLAAIAIALFCILVALVKHIVAL